MRTFAVTRDLDAVALALLLGAVLAGCSQNNPQPPQSSTTTTVNGSPATAPMPAPNSTASAPATNNVNAGPGGAMGTNTAVADAVNKAIHTNVQLTGSRITAVVDSAGVATLTGTAQDQQQKALAARAATDEAGVISVKDKIEIVPTGGAKEKQAAAKVIHETKVIVLPGSANSAQSGSASNAAGSGNGSGAGTGSTSTDTNANSNSQAPAGSGSNNPPASGAQ